MDKNKLTQVVELVQKDSSQFEELYGLIADKVYFWCYVLVKNEADANDLFQESMISIYKSLKNVKEPSYFSTWMYRLVRNTGVNYLKRVKSKDLEFLEEEDYIEAFSSMLKDERIDSMPHKAFDLQQTKEIVKEFIENLPTKQKEVIYLRYLEEMKVEEISDILGYNAGTVKSSLFKARQNLKKQIEKYQKDNNVRIYSSSLGVILILAMTAYMDDVCSKADLQYNRVSFEQSTSASPASMASALSSKVIIGIVSAILITGAIIGGIYLNQIDDSSKIQAGNEPTQEEIDMTNKIKGNPYIKDIYYPTFPTRTSVKVTITLKQKIDDKNIKVLLEEENISFTQDGKDMFVQATENGIYSIIIHGEKLTFEIKQINKNALEVTGAIVYKGYIKIIVDGEEDQLDIDKSYVEYKDKKYSIEQDLTAIGEFRDNIEVVIYNKQGQYRGYVVNVE